ncbi:MAG: NDP-sugar synthase [Saccharothrix sp.]|nr:NDP-sugar synthase [Saccharothrix sp.]
MKIAGFVLAAGVGSRLAPITDGIPKPMMPIGRRPLLGYLVDRLVAAGVSGVFVNLHAHSGVIEEFLDTGHWAVPVEHRREPALTGPAGALTLFADELRDYDAILVVSGDVLLDTALDPLVHTHFDRAADFTFGVVHTTGARRYGVLDVAQDGTVVGAREKPDVPDHERHAISAGVYCLAPHMVDVLQELLRQQATVDYARHLAPHLLSRRRPVAAWELPGYWIDVGTPSALREASIDALHGRIDGFPDRSPVHVSPSARLEPEVELRGSVLIGPGARIGRGATVVDTVVLPGAEVAAGTAVLGGLVAGHPDSVPTRWWVDS